METRLDLYGSAYAYMRRRYILFYDQGHPQDRGAAEIEAFLTHLAVQGKAAPSTENEVSELPAAPLQGIEPDRCNR